MSSEENKGQTPKRRSLQAVPERVSFPEEEQKVLEYWNKIKAFETSLKLSEGRPEYTFYDGPPFATGLPHYGHLLAGTIKDTVTRFWHQRGHHVSRRFGWDCHGLPVEYEIDQKLGIKSSDDVMKMGVDKYNEECRSIVQRYTKEWEASVKRLGRWIDFRNDYKTMDSSYMESIWWVFKQLWEKDLVYLGFKVMPYSTACATPLSNFEAKLEYRNIRDPAVVVAFPVSGNAEGKENPHAGASLVAWTTTPWTLPSNLALCVNPELDYVKVKDSANGNVYILLKDRLVELYPAKKKKKKKNQKETPPPYTVQQEMKGEELIGLTYEPLFDYFVNEDTKKRCFRVVGDAYVDASSGTGVVHQAPAFGEDDYRVCLREGVVTKDGKLVNPVDQNGRFTDEVTDWAGRLVKATPPKKGQKKEGPTTDDLIIARLKEMKRLVKRADYDHPYPFCWRSDTPLIYKAVPSWFVRVERIRDQIVENNKKTRWVPPHVQHGRFHKWLESARDWAISRNRYWGTPLPIWMSEDGTQRVVVGSIAELEKLTGASGVDDLHKHHVDELTIPDPRGSEYKAMRRVPEVFDCWFESGSMPYAQQHYPFENKDNFDKLFPADFVAEGLDQTRGWFYTLMVLSTALFGEPAFKNLICNGMILAEDGKKMSKRLKNYPDPNLVVSRYGADALRLYLITSPAVRAEPLCFSEAGVFDVVKTVILPWFHAYRFFCENVLRYERSTGKTFVPQHNITTEAKSRVDQWIISELQSLLTGIHGEMESYKLYAVVPRLLNMIELLCNWYIRLNRGRLKGMDGAVSAYEGLSVVFYVLSTVIRLMSPFTPFTTEFMYQNLRPLMASEDDMDSVHFLLLPKADPKLIKPEIEADFAALRSVIELGRVARHNARVPNRKPLKSLVVVHQQASFTGGIQHVESYLLNELNIRELTLSTEVGDFVRLEAVPDNRALGQRLKGKARAVKQALQSLPHDQVCQLRSNGSIEVEGETVTLDEVEIKSHFTGDTSKFASALAGETLVVLSLESDPELELDYLARGLVRAVQQSRKDAKVTPEHRLCIYYAAGEKKVPDTPAESKEAESGDSQGKKGAQKGKKGGKKGGKGGKGKQSEKKEPVRQAKKEAEPPSEYSIAQVLQLRGDFIRDNLFLTLIPVSDKPDNAVEIFTANTTFDYQELTLVLTRASPVASPNALAALKKADGSSVSEQDALLLADTVAMTEPAALPEDGKWTVRFDGEEYQLEAGTHYFANAEAAYLANMKKE